jgi:hypothetical protein
LISGAPFARPFVYDVVHVNSEFAAQASDHEPEVLLMCEFTKPSLSVSVSPNNLWPPNHKYVTVNATATYSDNADSNPTLTLVSVTSDEPDSGLGPEDLPNDIVIVNDLRFRLRAERDENGDGRVYTITYRVTDGCGNFTEASATVTVPHNQGK